MKTPSKEVIRDMVNTEGFQWFLWKTAQYLNDIDTVRNVEKGDELVARKLVIRILENALADVYEAGKLAELQKKVAEDETNIIKQYKNLKEEY